MHPPLLLAVMAVVLLSSSSALEELPSNEQRMVSKLAVYAPNPPLHIGIPSVTTAIVTVLAATMTPMLPKERLIPRLPPTPQTLASASIATSVSPLPSASEKDLKPSNQAIQVSKKQLEAILGLALDAHFDLNVVSEELIPENGTSEVMGTIPVHLKVKELTVGGVSTPVIDVSSINQKVDPINYGNIRD
ncbi:hypothetical protein EDD11_002678 [Mortierella claussenii]|nr:hypothetical protein EDD11_002678 [Mortierella claussenii]